MRPHPATDAEAGPPDTARKDDPAARQTTSELTARGLEQWGISCSTYQLEQLMRFRDILLEWNAERMNLTRLISPTEIAAEHFLDSASLLTALKIAPGASVLDIGAGAGFPSLPLAILRPDLKVTLLEATAKKLVFCDAASQAAGLDMRRMRFIHGRAEDERLQYDLGASFDVVTARAVAPLAKLALWCAPYIKRPGGVFAALKGAVAEDENSDARSTLSDLRLSAKIIPVSILGSERTHTIITCRSF